MSNLNTAVHEILCFLRGSVTEGIVRGALM
jgi:hypothetical protein